MWRTWQTGSILVFFLLWAITAVSQTVAIQSIQITGHKRTREAIIHRELTFAVGDTLLQKDLGSILERNRSNLMNLGIFNDVVVNISEWNTREHVIDIAVDVKESWYIYAVPILELADRNFNVWWTTYNHALDRLNLGARMEWLNFSGRNDKLKGKIQVGFTPKQEIEYRLPYFNRRQSLGASINLFHSSNREMSPVTIGNKEQFVNIDDRRLIDRWRGDVSFIYRPSIFLKYELLLGYQYVHIDNEIASKYNPLFFRDGGNRHRAFSSRLIAEYDDRDIKLFPTKGYRALFELEKNGLSAGDDENRLAATFFFEANYHMGRRIQHRLGFIGQYSLSRSRPSLMHYETLGTSKKYISGYELYLFNGLDAVVGKYQISAQLFRTQYNLSRAMPLEQFRIMPISLYFTLNAETGYINDPFTGAENSLSNRWLVGGGPGIALMLYNNFLFQVNYSINHLGERGLFIHNSTSF
jgi:outer membrane protein assembly factor BamA